MADEHKTLTEEIRDVLNARKTPGFDDLPNLTKVRILAPEIAEATCVAMQGLDPDQQAAMIPQYVEAAETLFDELVVPIDLPGVGPVAEITIEGFLRQMIRPAVEAAAKRLAA